MFGRGIVWKDWDFELQLLSNPKSHADTDKKHDINFHWPKGKNKCSYLFIICLKKPLNIDARTLLRRNKINSFKYLWYCSSVVM